MSGDPRTAPLRSCLELNTRLFESCLSGVDEATALHRPGPASNNMSFIAAHLVDARRYLANLLGPEVDNPFSELGDGESIDDFDELPTVERLLAAWREVSTAVLTRLEAVSAEELDRQTEQAFPVDDPTLLGAIAFLSQHDAYHVGQLAYLRKLAGLGAMSYE